MKLSFSRNLPTREFLELSNLTIPLNSHCPSYDFGLPGVSRRKLSYNSMQCTAPTGLFVYRSFHGLLSAAHPKPVCWLEYAFEARLKARAVRSSICGKFTANRIDVFYISRTENLLAIYGNYKANRVCMWCPAITALYDLAQLYYCVIVLLCYSFLFFLCLHFILAGLKRWFYAPCPCNRVVVDFFVSFVYSDVFAMTS